MQNRKSILFIGGCGFIGSNLIRRFVVGGTYDVHVFDIPGVSTERIDDLLDDVHMHYGDLRDKDTITDIFDSYGIEIVVHLVSTLLPNSDLSEYQREIDLVIKPSIDIIHMCAERRIRFVFFSSGGTIYGNNGNLEHLETDTLAPISYYGLSKCNLENVILIENRRNKLPYLILRPSNPYGHGQRLYARQGLIAVSIGKVLRGEPIVLIGDGRNVRDYIHIGDLAEYVFQLISMDIVNEIFNIGSGRGYTNSEIIDIVREVCGRDVEVVSTESRTGDVKGMILNVDKLKARVDISTKSLKEGIEEFWIESSR